MTVDLTGKVALVTGASRGIGHAVASAFKTAGAEVHILADDTTVEDAAEAMGVRGHFADITDNVAVAAVIRKIPKLDILVNNAGLERLTPVEDRGAENEAVFRRVLSINVVGTFLMTRAALERMGPGGRIINTASIWGRVAEPLFGAYVASKHALIGLTKTWAKELGHRGINVNAVAPGWVRTVASMRSLKLMAERSRTTGDVLLDQILADQALPGLMEPVDIVGPYLFLASDLAANVTGQTLGADRGEVPW